jgi:hypothetical protein
LNINTFTCNARTKIFGGPVYTLVTTIKESVFRCGNSVSSEEEDSKTLKIHSKEEKVLTKKPEGCLTVHLPHEITWNTNLMQQGNFIDVFSALHVSDAYGHHQEH